MDQYNVTGMTCAACSARVEKAVSKVEGVTSCSVSLLTISWGLFGTASAAFFFVAVFMAGYVGGNNGDKKETAAGPDEDLLKDTVTPVLRQRLIWSVGFLVVLMYFSMGAMMWNWPLPAFMEGNHVLMGIIQSTLTVIIMILNKQFFISGF